MWCPVVWIVLASLPVGDCYRLEALGSKKGLTKADIEAYLVQHASAEDKSQQGFHSWIDAAASRASEARSQTYAASVPDDIFLEYVAEPFVLDEPRGPLPSQVVSEVKQSIAAAEHGSHGGLTVRQAAAAVFGNLGPSLKLKFLSNSTPQIMSPEAVLQHRGASCTGLSILFVQALRSAGVPARIAGTGAWNGNEENGNHNWVEVYTNDCGSSSTVAERSANTDAWCDPWSFIEAPFDGKQDGYVKACDAWFCRKEKLGHGSNTTVFASRAIGGGSAEFPTTWTDKRRVRAEGRTKFYERVCGSCK
jgi:hypothetical protein